MKLDSIEEEILDVYCKGKSILIVGERSLKISSNCVRFAHLLYPAVRCYAAQVALQTITQKRKQSRKKKLELLIDKREFCH